MAISDNEKLNAFAAEAYAEADAVCGEVKSVIEKERQEKLESGRKKLLGEMRDKILVETERIRRGNSLAVSRRNTELRQEYLLKIDEAADLVLTGVHSRLKKFTQSDEYKEYLKKITLKIMSSPHIRVAEKDIRAGGMTIYYMERDAAHTTDLKIMLSEMGYFISQFNFVPDEGIKIGGLKFHPNTRNIQINETLDEKLERSVETLNALIGKQFHEN